MNIILRACIYFSLLYSYQSVAGNNKKNNEQEVSSVAEITMANTIWKNFFRCSNLAKSNEDKSKFFKCTGQYLSPQLSILQIKSYSVWPMMMPNKLRELKNCSPEQIRKFPLAGNSDVELCFSFEIGEHRKKDALVQFNFEDSVLKIVNFIY